MRPALALEQRPDATRTSPTPEAGEEATDHGGPALVCRLCKHVITTEGARASLFGAHVHDRMNPGGFVFRIGVFHHAPGALAIGAPSAHFSWFPGHLWQIALCRGCLEHLGWFFSGPSSFSGLILDKLAEEDGGGAQA
jgi:hypothetical protein